MNEPIERSTPPPRPPRRPRRFVMPAEHHDSRVSERIEAFLEGPTGQARTRSRAGLRRPRRTIVLVSQLEWREALLREEVRLRRYGRPATVMVVDVAPGRAGDHAAAALTAEQLVAPILEAIRQEARETDQVVRTSATRLHLLLPETGAVDADQVAERLRRAARDRLNGHGDAHRLRVEFGTASHGRSLGDALEETERRLAD